MLKSFLDNYFGFNKQQRNGLFVLIAISLFLLVVRLVYPVFIKPDNIVLLDLPLLERRLDSNYKTLHSYSNNKFHSEAKSLNLFVFDPNTVSIEQLLQLGLKEKTAQILLKFRNKGFAFKQKSDLKKVYGISDKLFAQLEPYILINETKPQEKTQKPEEVKPSEAAVPKQTPSKKIELNTADSASLVSLDGIGPGYAKRILKYRTMLGGYVSVEQLKEVYGFSEELYEKVKSNCYVEAKNIKKINLNKDEFKVINKHPYLTYELTKSVFDWRRKTTINATNLKEILNDNTVYQKVFPYLAFD